MSIVGEEATIAPDSALIVSPAASSTRTIGKAPGYKISCFISFPLSRPFLYRHPSVQPVTGFRPLLQITQPKPPDVVLRNALPHGRRIHSEQPCSIQSEHLCLSCERRVVMLFDQGVRNLEAAKRFDLPLRRSIPDRVRSPQHVIITACLQDLAEEVRTDQWMTGHQLTEGRAKLHIDVAHARMRLLHSAEFSRPGYLAGLGEHLVNGLSALHAGMVDEKIDVRKVFGRLDEILRVIVIRDRTEG